MLLWNNFKFKMQQCKSSYWINLHLPYLQTILEFKCKIHTFYREINSCKNPKDTIPDSVHLLFGLALSNEVTSNIDSRSGFNEKMKSMQYFKVISQHKSNIVSGCIVVVVVFFQKQKITIFLQHDGRKQNVYNGKKVHTVCIKR